MADVVRLDELLRPVVRRERVVAGRRYSLLGVRWYGNGCHEHDVADGASIKTPALNRVREGDVTYNKMWVTRGAFGVVRREHDGFYATSEYPTFVADAGRTVPEFLRYALTDEAFVEQARRACSGTTSRARLHPDEFLRLYINLPPLPQQRRIAALLSAIDETVARQRVVVQETEQVLASTMTEVVGMDLHEAGHPLVSIGDLAHFSGGNGFTPRDWADSGLPIIRIQNLNGRTEFNYFDGQPKDEWIVEPGELLFAWAGSRGSSFGPCIWPGPRGVLNQHIHRLVPRGQVSKRFLYWMLRFVTAEVEKRAHGFKDTLVHLRKGELTGWRVPLPPQHEQDDVASMLDHIATTRDLETRVLDSLRASRKAVSTALLGGAG